MVFDAPTPPDYRQPENKELVLQTGYEAVNNETTFDLLAFLAREQTNLKNNPTNNNDTPTPDPENSLSDKRTQQIQKALSDEFSEEITAIIETITTKGIDKTTYDTHMKEMKQAFAGGRGRQGRTLVKKAGLGASVGVRKKTKGVFKKPTMTKPEESTDEQPKDILGNEIEKAFRELPELQAKIQEVLTAKIDELLAMTTKETAQEPQRLLGPLAALTDALVAAGFHPDEVWKRSEAAQAFTNKLQAFGKTIKQTATRQGAYDKFVSAITTRGIDRFLSFNLVSKQQVDSRTAQANTTSDTTGTSSAVSSSTNNGSASGNIASHQQVNTTSTGGTLPSSGFTTVGGTTNTIGGGTSSPVASGTSNVITVQPNKTGTSQPAITTYPSAADIAEATKKESTPRKPSRGKGKPTTNTETAVTINDNPEDKAVIVLDENTTLTTEYITSTKTGPDGRGAVAALSPEQAANKVFHMELESKFANEAYSFAAYPKKYLNFHGSAGSEESLIYTMIADKSNLFNIIILKNGAIIIGAHPKHGGLAACPEAMIQGDPLALEHSIPVEFSSQQLTKQVLGRDGKAYYETELPTKEQQEAFVRLQGYLAKAYGYKGLQPISSAQVVTGSDGNFITPPASDTNGLHTDTFSRRRDSNGNVTAEGKRIAALRGRNPDLKQLQKPIAQLSLPELTTLDAALTAKLKALGLPKRKNLLPETTQQGVDYFTGMQKQVQAQITILQEAEARRLEAERIAKEKQEAAEKERKFLAAKQQGDTAFNAKKRDDAETAYNEALTNKPGDAYCTGQLAKIAEEKSKENTPSAENTTTPSGPGGSGKTRPENNAPAPATIETTLSSLETISGVATRLDSNVKKLAAWQIGGNNPREDFKAKVADKITTGKITGSILVYLPLTTDKNQTEKRKLMETFFTKGGVYSELTAYATTKGYTVYFTDSYPDGGQTNTIKSDGTFGYDIFKGNGGKITKVENKSAVTISTLVSEAKKLF